MPKMKTHRGAAKRIRATGSGKLVHRRSGRGHYMLSKGNKARRRDEIAELSPGDSKVAKRMLGL